MATSNFPNGFAGGVNIRGVPVLNTYGGQVFWVDSAVGGNGNKGSFDRPFATIDYAVGRCTANNGDIIMVKPGHTETVTAAAGLALDVAGITIHFLGNDNDRARINFTTATTADMDVDAADITLINPRFTAGVDALVGPIDVNSARFTIINGLWEDGIAINTVDCIVADANADDMTIDGWTFRDGDGLGTQKQSQIQIAAATRPTLKNIQITGDFGTGPIENGTAWIDAYLERVNIDNANTGPVVCVLLQATSTGTMKDCTFRVASGTTYITANNDMQFFECFGTGTDATAGEKIGTQLAGDIEAKIDVIDGYHDVPAADDTANAQMRDVIGNKTDAAATGAVSAVESLMAYAKQVVTELQVVDGYFDVPTVDGTADATVRDVVGKKDDAGVQTAGADKSILAYAKGAVDMIGGVGITTYPAAAAPANGISLAEVMREVYDQSEKAVTNSTAVLVDATTIFTITGGPIEILSLVARCVTDNDGTASTLQWSADPTDGAAATFSAASASLASLTAGATVVLQGTTLATAPIVNTTGVGLGQQVTNGIVVGAGIITTTIGVGSTTGTWQHHLRYRPLARGVTVS